MGDRLWRQRQAQRPAGSERVKRVVLLAAAALLAGACHEIPQDAAKPFAGKDETALYDSARFKDDKAAFEKALASRAQKQNEYVRMDDDKTR
jgi:hypothetical protein